MGKLLLSNKGFKMPVFVMAGTTGCHKAVKERFKEHKGYITQHYNLLRKGKAKALDTTSICQAIMRVI